MRKGGNNGGGAIVVFLLFSFPAVWWRVWREENYERSLDQNLEEFFKTKSCPNKQAVQKGGPNEPYAKCEMDCEQKTIKFIPDKFNKKSTDMGIIWTNYLSPTNHQFL